MGNLHPDSAYLPEGLQRTYTFIAQHIYASAVNEGTVFLYLIEKGALSQEREGLI